MPLHDGAPHRQIAGSGVHGSCIDRHQLVYLGEEGRRAKLAYHGRASHGGKRMSRRTQRTPEPGTTSRSGPIGGMGGARSMAGLRAATWPRVLSDPCCNFERSYNELDIEPNLCSNEVGKTARQPVIPPAGCRAPGPGGAWGSVSSGQGSADVVELP